MYVYFILIVYNSNFWATIHITWRACQTLENFGLKENVLQSFIILFSNRNAKSHEKGQKTCPRLLQKRLSKRHQQMLHIRLKSCFWHLWLVRSWSVHDTGWFINLDSEIFERLKFRELEIKNISRVFIFANQPAWSTTTEGVWNVPLHLMNTHV